MNIIYGCDCNCDNHSNNIKEVPCAYLIERNGKEMKVCTRCILSKDKQIALLFDGDTISKTFSDYDATGWFVMLGELHHRMK